MTVYLFPIFLIGLLFCLSNTQYPSHLNISYSFNEINEFKNTIFKPDLTLYLLNRTFNSIINVTIGGFNITMSNFLIQNFSLNWNYTQFKPGNNNSLIIDILELDMVIQMDYAIKKQIFSVNVIDFSDRISIYLSNFSVSIELSFQTFSGGLGIIINEIKVNTIDFTDFKINNSLKIHNFVLEIIGWVSSSQKANIIKKVKNGIAKNGKILLNKALAKDVVAPVNLKFLNLGFKVQPYLINIPKIRKSENDQKYYLELELNMNINRLNNI